MAATGYTRADVSNNIDNAKVANASDIDAEFDAVQTAFDATNGHTHDGTSAKGGPITKVGPTQDIIVSGTSVLPKTDSVMDLGSETYRFKELHVDTIRVAGGEAISLVTDWTSFNFQFEDETGNVCATTGTARWRRIGDLVFVVYQLVINLDSTGMVAGEKVLLEIPVAANAGFLPTMSTFISDANWGSRSPGGLVGILNAAGTHIEFIIYSSEVSTGGYGRLTWGALTDGVSDFHGGSIFYEAA